MEDALRPFIDWLATQWHHQAMDLQSWRAQFDPEEGQPLYEAYTTARSEAIKAGQAGCPTIPNIRPRVGTPPRTLEVLPASKKNGGDRMQALSEVGPNPTLNAALSNQPGRSSEGGETQ